MDLICQSCGREVVLHASLLKCEENPFLRNSLELGDNESPGPQQHDQAQQSPQHQIPQTQPQRTRSSKIESNKLRVGSKIEEDFLTRATSSNPTTVPSTTPPPIITTPTSTTPPKGDRDTVRVRGRETEKEFRLDKKSKSYSGAQIKKMTMSSQHSQKTQQQSYNHHQLTTAKKILEMASEMTDVDFPVCGDCLDGLLSEYKSLARQEMKESEAHKTFFDRFEKEIEGGMGEVELAREIKQLEEEERRLAKEVERVEAEREEVRRETEKVKFENRQLDVIETKFFEDFNRFLVEENSFQEKKSGLDAKLAVGLAHLEKLEQTDVLNDIFHIWHDGHFGTINEYRLGRLPSQQVEWNEINAAWGQTCHLLQCIAKKLNYEFKHHKLIPMGSFSRIVRLEDESKYELYGSSDISLGRLLRDRRFDTAMIAFLKCLKEICDYVNEQDPAFEVPYPIEKEKVGEMNIRTHFSNDAVWTKALKYMLIDLKMLLAWVIRRHGGEGK